MARDGQRGIVTRNQPNSSIRSTRTICGDRHSLVPPPRSNHSPLHLLRLVGFLRSASGRSGNHGLTLRSRLVLLVGRRRVPQFGRLNRLLLTLWFRRGLVQVHLVEPRRDHVRLLLMVIYLGAFAKTSGPRHAVKYVWLSGRRGTEKRVRAAVNLFSLFFLCSCCPAVPHFEFEYRMIHGSLAHVAWGHRTVTTVTTGGAQRRRHGVGGDGSSSVSRPCAYNPRGPPFETPHKGYHYTGQRGRFFEGWYWRVTLPGDAESFALIYSIEDPRGGEFSGVGAQVRPIPRWVLRLILRWVLRCPADSNTRSRAHALTRSPAHPLTRSPTHPLVVSLVRSWGRTMDTFCTIRRTCPNSGQIGVGWL